MEVESSTSLIFYVGFSISCDIGRTNWNLKISKYLVMITIQAMIFGYFRQESQRPFFLVVKGSLLEI